MCLLLGLWVTHSVCTHTCACIYVCTFFECSWMSDYSINITRAVLIIPYWSNILIQIKNEISVSVMRCTISIYLTLLCFSAVLKKSLVREVRPWRLISCAWATETEFKALLNLQQKFWLSLTLPCLSRQSIWNIWLHAIKWTVFIFSICCPWLKLCY